MAAILVEKLSSIDLGRQGENLARTIEIDVNSILEKWPDASITLLVKRKGDTEPYPAETSVVSGILRWPVTKVDTANAGEGKIEIHAVSGEIIAKSVIATIRVSACLAGTETGEVPEAAQGWVDNLIQKADDMKSALEEAKEIVQDAWTAPPIVVEADGALVAIGDGVARPVVRLVSSMAAVQAGSGEPSPDNVRAIAGWDAVRVWRTGRNLLDASRWRSSTNSGITLTNNGDGSVMVSGTNTAATVANISASISMTLKPGTYTVSGVGSTAEGCYSVVTYRRAGAVSFAYGCKTFEIDAEQTVTCVIQVGVGATVDVTLWPMIEAGGSATAFEPYQVAELTAALPETVYGGRLDWVSGLLTVTHGLFVLDGTEAWGGGDSGSLYYLLQGLPRAGVSAVPPMCSHYPGADVYHTSQEGVQATPTKIWLRDRRFVADAAGLQAWFAAQTAAGTPVQIVYQLAEPYTIQLDPQTLDMLKGGNAVWSDCGDTAVAYVADTKIYIDNKFTALQSAILAMGVNI